MTETLAQQKAEMSGTKPIEGDRERQEEKIKPFIERARELYTRHPSNPIITPADLPCECKAVCNPGACLVGDDVVLLLRVIDKDDHSHLYVARSADGIGNWRIDPKPLLSPTQGAEWYDDWGCEDPRITYMPERGEYMIVYVGWSRFGAGVCLATTQDFKTAERQGMMIHPYNKDAVLLPKRIAGEYQLLHRPTAGPLENIWISKSTDLKRWGEPCCVLEETDQPGWDSGKVGAGPPPIETSHGWLLIYHGVKQVDHGWEYRFGLAMLDRDDPSHMIGRWPEWVFGPTEPWEMSEKGVGIVFPTGLVVRDDTQYLYYGAGDKVVGLATAKLEMLRQLRQELEMHLDDGDLRIV